MRSIKKLLSIVTVLTLVLALGASAFAAAPEKADITISDANGTGSTYEAYRLLDLTTSAAADTNDKTSKGFAYTVNPKYLGILEAVTGIKDAPDAEFGSTIIKYIKGLDTDALRAFADAVFEKIEAAEPAIGSDAKATGPSFVDVDQGYYLIVENLGTDEGSDAAVRSLVMLDTAGRQDVTVTTKEEKPSSEKKVKDVNDSDDKGETGWQDSADYDIGDAVPFQLKATIPAGTTVPYETYALTFHDVESEGLTFYKDSVKVFVNGSTALTGGYTVNAPGADGCTFEIVFDDIKTIPGFNEEDDLSDVITVEYSSELNKKADIGNPGNTNRMHIEYSNNSYGEGTGKTPDDIVTVFTFELDVKKVGPDGEEPLKGAGFTLFKKGAEGEYAAVGAEVKGEDIVEFVFSGLDDGDYRLEETTVPPGYNKADDIEFTVAAEHPADDKGANKQEVTGLTVNVTAPVDAEGAAKAEIKVDSAEDGTATGKLLTSVKNMTGLELPSTGGIGTTIFYVAGGILVAGAVILLVTRKRVSGAEK